MYPLTLWLFCKQPSGKKIASYVRNKWLIAFIQKNKIPEIKCERWKTVKNVQNAAIGNKRRKIILNGQ